MRWFRLPSTERASYLERPEGPNTGRRKGRAGQLVRPESPVPRPCLALQHLTRRVTIGQPRFSSLWQASQVGGAWAVLEFSPRQRGSAD